MNDVRSAWRSPETSYATARSRRALVVIVFLLHRDGPQFPLARTGTSRFICGKPLNGARQALRSGGCCARWYSAAASLARRAARASARASRAGTLASPGPGSGRSAGSR